MFKLIAPSFVTFSEASRILSKAHSVALTPTLKILWYSSQPPSFKAYYPHLVILGVQSVSALLFICSRNSLTRDSGNARDPAWRWTTGVLAATTRQGGSALCPHRCPDILSNGWEFAVDAWSVRIQRIEAGRASGGKSARGRDVDTSQLNALDSLSNHMKRNQQRAT